MGAGGEAGGREAGLTEVLARFLAGSRWDDIPAQIRHEEQNLPNPAPVQGNLSPSPAISYSVATAPQQHQVSAK